MFAEVFQRLCGQKGVSVTKVATDIGIAPTTAYDWIRSDAKPRMATLKKVADYFGVDVTFFDEPFPEPPIEEPQMIPVHVITMEEAEMLTKMKKLSDSDREFVMRIVDALVKK